MLARSVIQAWDHHIDEATPDILLVEFLPCALHIILVFQEHKREASFLTLSHFKYDIVVIDAIVREEVLHIVLGGLIGDSSQLDTPV